MFSTFQYMAFADVMMVAATSPLFTVFFARIILKEPIYHVDILNVMIVFGGIVLIAKPPFLFGNAVTSYFDNADTTIAIVVLFVSSVVLQSGIFITLRLLKHIGKFIWHYHQFCTIHNY